MFEFGNSLPAQEPHTQNPRLILAPWKVFTVPRLTFNVSSHLSNSLPNGKLFYLNFHYSTAHTNTPSIRPIMINAEDYKVK